MTDFISHICDCIINTNDTNVIVLNNISFNDLNSYNRDCCFTLTDDIVSRLNNAERIDRRYIIIRYNNRDISIRGY
jgi:hypothetical protein